MTQRRGQTLIKLIDLGLARRHVEDEARVTIAGSTLGTVDYMSPEQARDSTATDIRSDIYSLGCTWYHLLAGRPPFAEGNVTERVYKHIGTPPPDIREFNPDVPPATMAILDRMLAKSPDERYQTPEELLRALEGPGQFEQPISIEVLSGLVAEEPRQESEDRNWDEAASVPLARHALVGPRRGRGRYRGR